MPFNFVIYHFKKKDGAVPNSSENHGFFFDTCQRQILISTEHDTSRTHNFRHDEKFSNADAYAFLLRVLTGLESAVTGETDVFGQFKDAWSKTPFSPLDSWIQKLYEDCKEIRSRYLRDLGSTSYGSLVRRLLKNKKNEGSILLVGAGALSQSIAPYLLEFELWLSNRSVERLIPLRLNLLEINPKAEVKTCVDQRETERVWETASAIVLCVPLDPHQDDKRINLSNEQTIIHLGCMKNESNDDFLRWKNGVKHFHPLDDLFEIQKNQNTLRDQKIEYAKRACRERALLRTLSSSIIAHGWEDLAVFL